MAKLNHFPSGQAIKKYNNDEKIMVEVRKQLKFPKNFFAGIENQMPHRLFSSILNISEQFHHQQCIQKVS